MTNHLRIRNDFRQKGKGPPWVATTAAGSGYIPEPADISFRIEKYADMESARPEESFEDFFEYTHTGFITLDTNGVIQRANNCIVQWLRFPSQQVSGRRFSDILTGDGKIYYETSLFPLLRTKGYFDEVLLDLEPQDGEPVKVTVNGFERRDENGQPLFIRLTVLRADHRYMYEQNLLHQKITAEKSLMQEKELALLREQFIAVLGHDLRNPLASVALGADVLARMDINEPEKKMVFAIQKSAARMKELISNVMDFARVRLGNGIGLELTEIDIVPVIEQVVGELQTAFPAKTLHTSFTNLRNIVCDPARFSQLLSNLLANAISHGAADTPVEITVLIEANNFVLSVMNKGMPISEKAMAKLFHPFTRNDVKPAHQGLGLGLYIASEIAHAHNGSLKVTSADNQTVFTFIMPLQ